MNIQVNAKSKSYEVTIGANILSDAFQTYASLFNKADHVFVLTDENVWKRHEDYFRASMPFPFYELILPAGEKCKSFPIFEKAHTFLLEHRATRKSLIIALGGGAVGDLAGFVAATYMRGIPFIQVPTTILAHDSAVGGKTAINHSSGKNMIGAFYQPEAVIYDTSFLTTLPAIEVRSGMAEVVKHAMLSDAIWYEELLKLDSFEMSSELLTTYLAKGIQVKASIVEQDETESSVRKFLNLGHTYGHALEAAAGYGKLTHGECVMIGLIYMLILSEMHGGITSEQTEQFINFVRNTGYPLDALKEYSFEVLLPYLLKDKKADYGELQFVLLQEIGKPFTKVISVDNCTQVDEQLRKRLWG